MTTTWHTDDASLAAYAAGVIDDARASSVEAHVLACSACRTALGARADARALDRMWEQVVDEVDAPRTGLVERGLRRLGVPGHIARLLSATPSLRLSWLIAEAVALGQAVVFANVAHGDPREDVAMWGFLMLAALVPVLGVAFAYGAGVDPTYEVGIASPMRCGRLLLLRATAVLVVSVGVAGVGALALPWRGWEALAWLLPSLGLTLATLALSTAVRPRVAGAVVAGGWIAVAVAAQSGSGDRFAVFRAGAQALAIVVIVVSVWALARRRETFETFEEGAFR
jgi:hypothetical protein